jgi:hypothetical protein
MNFQGHIQGKTELNSGNTLNESGSTVLLKRLCKEFTVATPDIHL